LAGWLDYNRGRFKEALPALEATISHFGRSAFADDAAWCVAFAQFQLGAWNEAGQALARYERLETKEMSAAEKQARVAYWRARIAEQAGKKDEGERGLKEVAARWPLSFYALAAEARLHRAGVSIAPPFGKPNLSDGAKKSSHPKPPTSEKVARDPDILRADELIEVGLDVEGGWWLGAHEAALVKRLGREAVPALLERYRTSGNFRRALRLAEVQDRGLLEAPPSGEGRAYWEAAFPRAYQALVDRFAANSGNPELYLYAIMKKESAFDPWDVSYADARGLLQMIPPTSSRVADELHVAFSPEMLFEPETNIRLGAHYIGALVKKFAGQIPLAAGAYNAGPKAMQRWVAQHGRHSMDEMVELIAFAQTREYVKRAVGIYAHYRYLYGPTPYELPLEVKTDVAPSGPDY
jgi:soluble lytic murein transglycosylase